MKSAATKRSRTHASTSLTATRVREESTLLRAMDQRTATSATDGDVSDINDHFRPKFHGRESNAMCVP